MKVVYFNNSDFGITTETRPRSTLKEIRARVKAREPREIVALLKQAGAGRLWTETLGNCAHCRLESVLDAMERGDIAMQYDERPWSLVWVNVPARKDPRSIRGFISLGDGGMKLEYRRE